VTRADVRVDGHHLQDQGWQADEVFVCQLKPGLRFQGNHLSATTGPT
jgi:hypothetical protein